MAERVRFELTERYKRSPAFEAGAFNHSTTSPRLRVGTVGALTLLHTGALLAKERLQLLGGFGFQNAFGHLQPMIRARRPQNVEGASVGTALGVACTVDEPFDSSRDHGASTHQTRFLGDVERRVGQTPSVKTLRCLA